MAAGGAGAACGAPAAPARRRRGRPAEDAAAAAEAAEAADSDTDRQIVAALAGFLRGRVWVEITAPRQISVPPPCKPRYCTRFVLKCMTQTACTALQC
jgi:hypothetical protein